MNKIMVFEVLYRNMLPEVLWFVLLLTLSAKGINIVSEDKIIYTVDLFITIKVELYEINIWKLIYVFYP